MIFDEAQAQLSHSMIEFLEQMRKDGGSVVYSFPNFKSMCNAHVDVTNAALDAYAVQIGRQRTDLDFWAEYLGMGSWSPKRKKRPQQFHDGYDIISLQDTSESQQETFVDGASSVLTRSSGTSHQEGFSHGSGWKEGYKRSWSSGWSEGSNDSEQDHPELGLIRSGGKSKGINGGESYSEEEGNSGNKSWSLVDGITNGFQVANGKTSSRGGSVSRTVATKNVPLARYRTEWFDDGYERTPDEHFAEIKRMLWRLGIGEFLFICGNEGPMPTKTIFVNQPFERNPLLGAKIVHSVIEDMRAKQAYFFVPQEIKKWQYLPQEKKSKDSSTTRKRWEI